MAVKQSVLKKKLGDLLVDVGIITPQQLEDALEEQKKRGGTLGVILMSLGYITEDVLLAFLGKQCGVSYISLSEYGEITEEIIKAVPESVVRHQTLIPIAKENNILTVAMADPMNVFATDDLRLMTGCEIDVVIASENEIKAAIDKYYGGKTSMDDIVKDMESKGAESDVDIVKEMDAGKDIMALESEGEDAPVIKIVNLLLSGAVKSKASDIHIEPYEKSLRVRYRIDGVFHEVSAPPKRTQNAMVSRLKIMSNLDIAEKRLPQDGRIKIKVLNKEVDLRISVLPTAFGEKVVMRILDASSLCLDLTKLGFEPESLAIYQKNMKIPYGIILVTGPTGSGKSTTLYSTLSQLSQPDVNISTIEDPVEYVLEGINQVHARADIGLTFAAGLKSFLRQDPDIIMVGEIRDTETAEIAINAALTGHLVLSTLHTNDSAGAITRLTNMGIEPFLISSTLIMSVAQRLVRKLCPDCRQPIEWSAQKLNEMGIDTSIQYPPDTEKVTLYFAKGCNKCMNTGYVGRIGCYEIMDMTDGVRELIIQRASAQEIKEHAIKIDKMATIRRDALRKLFAGVTTLKEVLRVSSKD